MLFLLCFATLRCHFATLNDWLSFTTFIPVKYITYGLLIIDYLDIRLCLIVLFKQINFQFEYTLDNMYYVIWFNIYLNFWLRNLISILSYLELILRDFTISPSKLYYFSYSVLKRLLDALESILRFYTIWLLWF